MSRIYINNLIWHSSTEFQITENSVNETDNELKICSEKFHDTLSCHHNFYLQRTLKGLLLSQLQLVGTWSAMLLVPPRVVSAVLLKWFQVYFIPNLHLFHWRFSSATQKFSILGGFSTLEQNKWLIFLIIMTNLELDFLYKLLSS